MGPRTASSCCCQARNLPWAPVPPPHAAARPVICHGPPYRLLMLLPGPQCLMGPLYGLPHCCCLHRHTLPCATFRSPHTAGVFHFCHRVLGRLRASHAAAARPVICHGPPYTRLLMLLPGQSRVSHGSLYGLPLLLSPSPHSAMCHFQVSSHCWCVPFFVIGC
ncbi:unnamed protein product, partial [Staurois parvus]